MKQLKTGLLLILANALLIWALNAVVGCKRFEVHPPKDSTSLITVDFDSLGLQDVKLEISNVAPDWTPIDTIYRVRSLHQKLRIDTTKLYEVCFDNEIQPGSECQTWFVSTDSAWWHSYYNIDPYHVRDTMIYRPKYVLATQDSVGSDCRLNAKLNSPHYRVFHLCPTRLEAQLMKNARRVE